MREHELLVFLLSLAVLLSAARLLGEIARRLGFPLIFGELASGIVLGPTVFGRIAPAGQHALFPGGVPASMLAGYTNVGVVLLLTVAGLEVNLGIVRRRGRSALLTSLLGIVMPLAGGVLLGVLLPDSDLMRPDRRMLFAFFMGVALSISALPVIAKTLLDLGLFKTDVGLLVMAAAMIDDLVRMARVLGAARPDAGRRPELPVRGEVDRPDPRLRGGVAARRRDRFWDAW